MWHDFFAHAMGKIYGRLTQRQDESVCVSTGDALTWQKSWFYSLCYSTNLDKRWNHPLGYDNHPLGYDNHLLGYDNHLLGYDNHLLGYDNHPLGYDNHLVRK